jgi:hypothetical protein
MVEGLAGVSGCCEEPEHAESVARHTKRDGNPNLGIVRTTVA